MAETLFVFPISPERENVRSLLEQEFAEYGSEIEGFFYRTVAIKKIYWQVNKGFYDLLQSYHEITNSRIQI